MTARSREGLFYLQLGPGLLLALFLLLPFIMAALFVPPVDVWQSANRQAFRDALLVSILAASVSTTLCVLFGVPLAYLLARHRFRGHQLVSNLVYLPLVVPPLMSGAMLLLVFGRRGLIGAALPSIYFTQSFIGIVIAQTFVASPFMILFARHAFERIDPRVEQAARILGRSSLRTWIEVTLPLSKRGLLIGAILTWLRALGELGATMMMAYSPHSLSIQVWEDNAIHGLVSALSGVLVVVLIVAILLVLLRPARFEEDP